MRERSTSLRPVPALGVGTAGVVAVSLLLLPFGTGLTRVAPALLLAVPVLVAGVLGGRLVAAAVAAEAAAAFAVGFLPPIGSPAVAFGADAVALTVFVVVAGATGVLTASIVNAERRRASAEAARNEALRDVDRQRTALLRSVSHDLRTPLATIRAAATDLDTDLPFDPAVRHELIGMVIDESERLDRLVANLLSLSRIEAGALLPDLQAVDLGELVEACVHRLRRLLAKVDVAVDIEPELPLVRGDYTQLDQVLSNLLENAVRHAPLGGTISVAARLTPGRRVELTVDDDGPGVGPELRDLIFEPFNGASGPASSGIGLAICRSVVEAHAGTIAVDDGPAGGARFTVTLPLDD